MIDRVYGDEDALVIVRLQAGLSVEIRIRGNRPAKTLTVVNTTANDEHTKANLQLR